MRYFVYSSVLIFCLACASSGNLGGGPKDEDAPVIDLEESTPDEQTNFDEDGFILVFDEYIQLDQRANVVVSPPLGKRPRYSVRGKELRVEFDEEEELRANTTYSFQFGNAIADLNESNPYENLRFVFSTGSYLDSLSVTGSVTDQATGKPSAGTVVMLYRSLEDSSFIRGEPDYLSYTDEDGRYELKNLAMDSFYLIAIKDETQDLQYQLGKEKIGFRQNDPFVLDGNQTEQDLSLIQESPPLQGSRLKEINRLYYRVECNQKTDKVYLEDSLILWQEAVNDSILIWAKAPIEKLILETSDEQDTALLKVPEDSLGYRSFSRDLGSNSYGVAANEPLMIKWTNPISDMLPDSARASDSLGAVSLALSISETDPRVLRVTGAWEPKREYEFILPEGSITDCYDQVNSLDTLRIRVKEPKDRSVLLSDITNLDSTKQYIVTLASGSQRLQTKVIDSTSQISISWGELEVTKHTIEIHLDTNQNGRRDQGSFVNRRPEEYIYREEINNLRAGWDVEVEIMMPEL